MEILKQLETSIANPFNKKSQWQHILDICQQQIRDDQFPYRKEMARLSKDTPNVQTMYSDFQAAYSDMQAVYPDMQAVYPDVQAVYSDMQAV